MRKLVSAGTLCVGLLVLHGHALAALGENAASNPPEQQPAKVSQRVVDTPQYAVDETQLDSGTRVREFVSANGTVFAVAWQGPFLPDLRQLLGRYFTAYTDAARNRSFGSGPLHIDSPELVVRSGGHMRAFSGRAYLPPELPENFSIDAIQ
ncbi:MAG: DUF2844 domain-containing protein [Candidatus Accumulibacter sp.]|jgi:hypothetical protein|nr:DUF2844 domain-containing protein [Accumulibacter sp.]